MKNIVYIAGAVLAGILVVTGSAALAQAYPSRPIRIISIFPPGGGNDILCRAVAQKVTENLKQQVIVENRPGANGIIGTEVAARSAPDGYTITLIPSGHAVNASLYRKLPFDSVKDFTPITLAGSSPLVVALHPSVPVKSVKELVALARARPGQISYGTAGVGSSGHLAGALFENMTGTTLVHIPYKGMSLAVTDVIGGQVYMTFGTSLSVVPHVRSARLRALAVTGAQRSPALPDLPTVAESGVPGYEASLWYGFVGPARLPAAIVQRLNAEIAAALAAPEVRERLASQGVDARSSTADEFARLLVSDLERWAKVVQRLGLRAD
ncbi:MAG: tripartite tricarboxylate transporter substrate binding protein [Betaproteobacteria bacterium]|nr:tripartite tricarboxylate transporter substrate binding protein [Betaproteobacteria bacterium]